MARERLGGLPPRYSFMLNPYSDVRLSKCPKCDKLTHMRKFPLLIAINGHTEGGPLVLGKTCRYCSQCELIMAHKDELDLEVQHALALRFPEAVGSDYFVLGTMDRRVWQRSLQGGLPLGDAIKHIADFKEYLDLHVEPGGWLPASEVERREREKRKKR